MAANSTPQVAAIYTRISDDREGRELGVQRQRDDCTALAKRLGMTIVRVYEDNDIGASTRSRKPRPQYQELLAGARAGDFSTVIAYTSSRLTRRPREHEDLIDLAERNGTRFQYVASPSFDLNTSAGRRIARILAANDAGEAEDIAERVTRAARQRAENGEFHGGHVTFGYQKSSGPAPIEPHPEHAEWVREAVRRLLAGETLYGICVDWNTKGRRTGWKRRDHQSEEATTWYPRTLKRVVTIAVIAGYREYDGQLYEAKWEPIVDREDWARLRLILSAPERELRGWSNGNARKYELSGLAFCATCKRVMVSMTAHRLRGASFICNKLSTGGCGQMRIAMNHLEPYIEAQVFAVADTPKLRAAIAAQGKDTKEDEKKSRAAIEKDQAALRRLTEDYDDGDIPRPEYRRRRARIEERIEAAERAFADATRARLHLTLPTGNELREQWPNRDNVWKRTVLSAFIERIEIAPHPTGMASNLTPRRNESPDDFSVRLERHRAEVLRKRVSVQWWH